MDKLPHPLQNVVAAFIFAVLLLLSDKAKAETAIKFEDIIQPGSLLKMVGQSTDNLYL